MRRPNAAKAANDNVMRPGGAYDRDTFRREYYSDPKSLLHLIDRLRFARAISGREPTSKPSKSNYIAHECGSRLYGIVVSHLSGTDRDLYRLHGLGVVYGDLHRLSRRLLIPMIDKWIAEGRTHAIVPESFVEMLTDAIRDRLWREYGEIKRVA